MFTQVTLLGMDSNKECTVCIYKPRPLLSSTLSPPPHMLGTGAMVLGTLLERQTGGDTNCSCLVQTDHAVDQSPPCGLYLPGQALNFLLEPLILFS